MDKLSISLGRKQRGIATLTILILVGIALSVAVLGMFQVLQGRQEGAMTVHAQTPAQITAWSGVDALSQYFSALEADDETLEDVVNALVLAMDAGPLIEEDDITAVIDRIEPAYDPAVDSYEIYFHVTGRAGTGKAQAISNIEVVYQLDARPISGGGGGGDVVTVPPSVINFDRNLRMSGSITVNVSPGDSYEINVNGTVETGGNSITGVDTIRATDSIQIGSGSTYKNVFCNADIAITGSVTVSTSMQALGNICFSGGTSFPGLIKANGFVYSNTSGSMGNVEARGASTYTGSNPRCNAYSMNDLQGIPYGVNLANSNTVGSVKSAKSVRNIGGTVSYLLAEGDVDVGYGKVLSGIVKGEKRYCGSPCGAIPQWKSADINVNINPALTVSIAELAAITMESTSFNAYDHEDAANYVFKYEGGNIKVTVKNVEGINSGTYYLMPFKPGNTTYYDYLCKEISGTTCLDAPETRKTICKTSDSLINNTEGRYANSNTCILYSGGRWSVGGSGSNPSIAQGIAWFEGDLEVKSGTFYNTFIATGNILTSGNHKTVAPNFAGPSGGGAYSGLTLKGICSNALFPHYPTQLCTAFSNDAPLVLANYAYMAGSISGTYVGGDIDLGSSTVALGSALAGNEFGSGGSTTIYGYITALGRSVQSIEGNRLSNSTTIVVTQLPATYTPQGGGSGTESGVCERCGSIKAITASPLWSRYL